MCNNCVVYPRERELFWFLSLVNCCALSLPLGIPVTMAQRSPLDKKDLIPCISIYKPTRDLKNKIILKYSQALFPQYRLHTRTHTKKLWRKIKASLPAPFLLPHPSAFPSFRVVQRGDIWALRTGSWGWGCLWSWDGFGTASLELGLESLPPLALGGVCNQKSVWKELCAAISAQDVGACAGFGQGSEPQMCLGPSWVSMLCLTRNGLACLTFKAT